MSDQWFFSEREEKKLSSLFSLKTRFSLRWMETAQEVLGLFKPGRDEKFSFRHGAHEGGGFSERKTSSEKLAERVDAVTKFAYHHSLSLKTSAI